MQTQVYKGYRTTALLYPAGLLAEAILLWMLLMQGDRQEGDHPRVIN
jgi:hypothetical protein